MSSKKILEQALELQPEEKFLVNKDLLENLDEQDHKLDEIWLNEAKKRLAAYRAGKLNGISMEEIFKDNK